MGPRGPAGLGAGAGSAAEGTRGRRRGRARAAGARGAGGARSPALFHFRCQRRHRVPRRRLDREDGPRAAGTPTRIVGSRVGRGVRQALTGGTRGGGCRVPGAARAGLGGVALLLTNCAVGAPLAPQVSVLHSQNG